MKRWLVSLGLCLALAMRGKAQAPVCPTAGSVGHCVYFVYERPGAPVPKYTLVMREDQTIKYWEGDPPFEITHNLVHLPIHKETQDAVFAARDVIDAGACETKLKHLAQTGTKTMRFWSGDVRGRDCIFNYPDDEQLRVAMEKCQAIAETMQTGTRLEHAHRFDRLGLDSQMDFFAAEVKDGRAIEVQLIRPTLESIRDDERVMERVRRKAALLLEASK